MTIIAPSILSADFLNFGEELKRLELADNIWIHLDIMDGHFVPNLTFGLPVLKKIPSISKHKLDAHFMVSNPEHYLDQFADFGLHNFTFHWESITHHDRFIQKAKEIYPSVGISLNPSTPLSVVPEYILHNIDLVLIMTVNPGFGGQSFIDGCVEKVEWLNEYKKKNKLSFEIQVDGGVKDNNAASLIKAGATNLVAGSYVFSEPNQDYLKRINQLRMTR